MKLQVGLLVMVLLTGCTPKSMPVQTIKEAPAKMQIHNLRTAFHSYTYKAYDTVKNLQASEVAYPGSDSILIEYLQYPHWAYKGYTYLFGNDFDEVRLSNRAYFITSDRVSILSPEIRDYYPSGALRYRLILDTSVKDSFIFIRQETHLFGRFAGCPVKEEFFWPNGRLRQQEIKDGQCGDSSSRYWTEDGLLRGERNRHRDFIYYPDSGLVLYLDDTLILGHYLSRVRGLVS